MQNRLPILVSIVVAALAVFLTNVYVQQVRLESQPATSAVIVAARDLPAGTVLEKKDIAVASRFTQSLPRLHVPFNEANLYLGQELTAPVQQDDYILASYFGGAVIGERKLSQQIDAKLNQRALTIPIDNEQAFEGSLAAGDRIDLLLTYRRLAEEKPPVQLGVEARAEFVTVPLLENVYVLATGRFGGGTNPRYRSITLLLSPDESKLLIWGMNLGKLSTLLRNPKDLTPTDRAKVAGGMPKLDNLSAVEVDVGEIVRKSREGGGS